MYFWQEFVSREIKVFVNRKFDWKCFLMSFVNFWEKQETAASKYREAISPFRTLLEIGHGH